MFILLPESQHILHVDFCCWQNRHRMNRLIYYLQTTTYRTTPTQVTQTSRTPVTVIFQSWLKVRRYCPVLGTGTSGKGPRPYRHFHGTWKCLY